MIKIKQFLNDVFLFQPQVFSDSRGHFFESFNLNQINKFGIIDNFVQDNHSYSKKNVLRGLHYQIINPQGKLVRCIRGRILDCCVDLRPNSDTLGQWATFELNSIEKTMVWIPPGFAHGFLNLTDECEILYKTTDFRYPEYERTLNWNCPILNINWGLDKKEIPILSEKDSKGNNFDVCVNELKNLI